MIALAALSGEVDGGEHGFNLFAGHVPEHRAEGFFLRYSKNPVTGRDELNADGLPEYESYKSPNRCESQIPCTGGIATGGLQVIEKSQDGGRVDGSQPQLVNRPAMLPPATPT